MKKVNLTKIISAAAAVALTASLLPMTIVGAAADTLPQRRFEWKSENLQDGAVTPEFADYDANTGVWTPQSITNPKDGAINPLGPSGTDFTIAKQDGFGGKSKDDSVIRFEVPGKDRKTAYKLNISTNYSKNVYNINGQSVKQGGYARYDIDFALTDGIDQFGLQVRNIDANNSWKNLFLFTSSTYESMGITGSLAAELSKDEWHHAEVILRNGTAEDANAHHVWLYLDGQKLADGEFSWNNKVINRINPYQLYARASKAANVYIDNIRFDYWNRSVPTETPEHDSIDLSTNNESLEKKAVGMNYANIDPTVTVGDYKSALKDNTLVAAVRDADGNTAADEDFLADKYIELTTSSGVHYYKYAYDSKTIIENTFDNEALEGSGDDQYPSGWGRANLGKNGFYGALSDGTAGKKANDKEYEVGFKNYSGASDQWNYNCGYITSNNPITAAAGDKIIVEFSMRYSNDSKLLSRWVEVQSGVHNSPDESLSLTPSESGVQLSVVNKDTKVKTAPIDVTKWHRYAFVFTQGEKSVEFWMDGNKMYADDCVLSGEFTGIKRFRLYHRLSDCTETPLTTATYFDDVKLSTAGTYSASGDALTSDVYAIDGEKGTIICGGTVRSEFDANVKNDNYYVIYDDASKTSTDIASMMVAPGMVVVAKNKDGVIKEYTVKEKANVYGNVTFMKENDNMTASREITNNGEDTLSGVIIMGSYDAANVLKGISVQSFSVEAKETKTVSAKPITANGDYYKVYVWNTAEDMMSLCDAADSK